MNCQHCNKHMYSYFDLDLSAQLRQDIDRHLAQCSSCRFQYDLTRQENQVLQDCHDIPALSADFNQRVMQAISQEPMPPVEKLICMSKDNPARRRWLSVFNGAVAAVVLLALCIYIPDIMSEEKKEIALKDSPLVSQRQTLDKTSVAMTGGTGGLAGSKMTSEQSKEHLSVQNDKDSAKTQLKLPAGQSYGRSGNPPVIAYKDDAGSAYWGQQDVGRSIRAEAPVPAPPSVSVWSLQNIPAQYQLLNMSNTGPRQTEYSYQNQDGSQTLTIKLIPVVEPQPDEISIGSVNDSSPQPQMRFLAAGSQGPSFIDRIIEVDNEKLKLVISGNMSTDELNNLASNIVINKHQ